MDLFALSGKKAIVAGGAGDLGKAMVAGLLDAGVEVVILDIAEGMFELAETMCQPDKPKVIGIRTNLADRNELLHGFKKALETLGTIDILVSAQGIQRRHPAEEFPLDEWDEVIEVNLTSVFELCQLAGRVMLEKGYGKIVNIASLISFTGGITIPAYAASKGGIAQITKALSNEWASRGVNVNAIAPGYMDTKMNIALREDPVRDSQILARIPVGRWGMGEDMVGPLLFLVSPASDYVTGVVLPVDGGWMGR
ncbi:MAG: SDR family oxidoreductase [Anaerolineales bacterium]|nr:MAG: SDR family oxidoreductase [Anaerolineales bacterium]